MHGLVNQTIANGIRKGYSKTKIRSEIKKLNINVGLAAFKTRYQIVKSIVGEVPTKTKRGSSKNNKR